MLLAVCAWHKAYHGYPRLLGLRVELIGADKVDAARASLAARPPDRTVVARWIAATFGATADAHA